MNFKFQNEDWFKPKKYLHFDLPLYESDKQSVEDYVSDPIKVSSHAFYPFITYEVAKYKMLSDDDGIRHLDSTGLRPISYASHLDSQIYSYYAKKLGVLYEQKLSDAGIGDNVLAFRKLIDVKGESKCNIHLANEAFKKISLLGNCRVYAFDIKSFFDNLDHNYLKKCWCDLLGEVRLPTDHFQIYKSLSTHAVVLRNDLYKTFNIPKKNPKAKGFRRICVPDDFRKKVRHKNLIHIKSIGIPQGSAMSAFLANMYMFEFDKKIQALMTTYNGYYYRYCDDILCIVPIATDTNIEIYIKDELDRIKLKLNEKKTEISTLSDTPTGKLTCDKPVQYLGFIFYGERKLIRTSSLSRYRRNAKKAIRLAKATMKKYNDLKTIAGITPTSLYRKKLFQRFYHTGQTNFIRYGFDEPVVSLPLSRLDSHCKSLPVRCKSFRHWTSIS